MSRALEVCAVPDCFGQAQSWPDTPERICAPCHAKDIRRLEFLVVAQRLKPQPDVWQGTAASARVAFENGAITFEEATDILWIESFKLLLEQHVQSMELASA